LVTSYRRRDSGRRCGYHYRYHDFPGSSRCRDCHGWNHHRRDLDDRRRHWSDCRYHYRGCHCLTRGCHCLNRGLVRWACSEQVRSVVESWVVESWVGPTAGSTVRAWSSLVLHPGPWQPWRLRTEEQRRQTNPLVPLFDLISFCSSFLKDVLK